MTDGNEIAARVAAFQADLRIHPTRVLVQKHVTYGPCFILDQATYFNLKYEIGNRFGVHHSEVLVVGSAKHGFSISPKKRFRGFCDTSDLDVAIVSADLFDKLWKAAYEYWRGGGFWTGQLEFQKYLFRGWLRPDKLPPELAESRSWWDFFRELTSSERYGPYQIRGGLYKSWDFLESYHSAAIDSCKNDLR